MSKILNCACGTKKPYRRAHSCYECWKKIPDSLIAKLKKYRTSLRLPKEPPKERGIIKLESEAA